MSEIEQTETTTNETTNEATDEVKEIEIPIEEKKQEVSVVKDISKLTLEERAKIITDARNGIPNEHYDVILLKNGNTRIVKKKNKTPTQSVASRLIRQTQNNQTPTPNKIYMSDTQIMMEHIIELNNQVNKLMTKQKKLKKKYKTLKYDIYEDVDENQITQEPKQEPVLSHNSYKFNALFKKSTTFCICFQLELHFLLAHKKLLTFSIRSQLLLLFLRYIKK